MAEERCVIHVDFDYFYAQCEEIRNPQFKNKPLCVCIYSNRGDDSGAVATANYVAREYGVRSGLAIYRARGLLKDADSHFIPVDFEYVSDISERAMSIMEGYADVFEYVGRDEAYLDVTARTDGSLKIAAHLGQQLKVEIRKSLGMTCSVGISRNKLLSKMASNYKKPDGLTIIHPDKTQDFLNNISLKDIHGLGKKTLKRLESINVHTIPDAQKIGIFDMQRMFGRKAGTVLYNSVRGVDDGMVQKRSPNVQYSKMVTLSQDTNSFEELYPVLATLCDTLHSVISERGLQYRTVGVQFIHSDMSGRSRSKTVRRHTASLMVLKETATALLKEALHEKKAVRRLGVKVSELGEARGQQDIRNYF